MVTVDCQPAPGNHVTELALPKLSSLNQQVYTRLRLALDLNLRGQIFVVVCDDGALRHHLANQLAAAVNLQSGALDQLLTDKCLPPQAIAAFPDLAKVPLSRDEKGGQSTSSALVSLTLHLTNPNILQQVNQWLVTHPAEAEKEVQGFQILGIEQLTREPVQIQRAFLDHLQILGKKRLALGSNLVLWVSRPWQRSIQQSAPEFWRWHTAIFEFEGDPTPTIVPHSPPERLELEQPLAPLEPVRRPISPVEVPSSALADSFQLAPSLLKPAASEVDLADLVLASVIQVVDQQSPQVLGGSAVTSNSDATALDLHYAGFEPLHLMQQIEELYQQTPSPTALAAAYRHLGDWYRSQVEQGNASVQNLTITIRAYEQVIHFLESDADQSAELMNDVGNLYWMLSRCSEINEPSLVYLEAAIAAYQQALSKTDPQLRTQSYAMIQNNLGSAYGDLARHSHPAQNLQKSIQAYQTALSYRPADQDPARYAATQNNLGTAYWNLAQHTQPVAHLQQAIAAYNEALRYYDPEQESLHFAMIQNNLGTAYWNLAQCDAGSGGHDHEMLDALPEDFLQLAIGAYRIALIYRTLEAAPAAYAATQNNLGTAYWHLANQPSTHYEGQLEDLKQAIAAYREALSTARYLTVAGTSHAPALTFDIFATHNNLGLACHQLGSDRKSTLDITQRSTYLEAALYQHIQALKGWEHNADLSQAVIGYIVQTVRSFYEFCGLKGQTQALSQIPPNLLSVVMKQL